MLDHLVGVADGNEKAWGVIISYVELVCYPLIMYRYKMEDNLYLIDDMVPWFEKVDAEWLRELEKPSSIV